MECNKEQEEAIMHRDGPAMVLAGPGAGKTYVITNRVKALIDEYGVKPEQILVVTFSKAAGTYRHDLPAFQSADAEVRIGECMLPIVHSGEVEGRGKEESV